MMRDETAVAAAAATTAGPGTSPTQRPSVPHVPEKKWHYSSRLCYADESEYFPFPLSLEPRKKDVRDGEYVRPDDVMDSMYSEIKIYQRNKLKFKLSRKLQLDYHQKELVIFASDDSVVARTAGANIVRADVLPGDPTGVQLVVRGMVDPITFFCESNEHRAKTLAELQHFREVIRKDEAAQAAAAQSATAAASGKR